MDGKKEDENGGEGKNRIVGRKEQEAPGARVYAPPVICDL